MKYRSLKINTVMRTFNLTHLWKGALSLLDVRLKLSNLNKHQILNKTVMNIVFNQRYYNSDLFLMKIRLLMYIQKLLTIPSQKQL